jgi:hypothetical protein
LFVALRLERDDRRLEIWFGPGGIAVASERLLCRAYVRSSGRRAIQSQRTVANKGTELNSQEFSGDRGKTARASARIAGKTNADFVCDGDAGN